MSLHRELIKRAFSSLGYSVRRTESAKTGDDPFSDMRARVMRTAPVLFDVGANIGQTAQKLRACFEGGTIYSFEPSQSTFKELQDRTIGIPNLHRVNCGMGAIEETKTFVENSLSDMSSFFEPGPACWGSVKQRTEIRIDTIDGFYSKNGIHSIDVLKSDTQGFELEVLCGAKSMMSKNRIHLVYLELTFSDMYQGMPKVHEILKTLFDAGFQVVSFYEMHHQSGLLGWTDALFINPAYRPG